MKIYLTLVGVLLTIYSAASENEGEPMVAFMCNRPAMHMSEHGWIKDDATNCLKDPIDILNYCRKMYPKLDVWNIVEASQPATVKNWCNFGHNRCHNKFSVRPFRCLIGSFESEALEVPEHCNFDHVHNAEECKSYGAWNQTTAELCAKRGMRLRGFSILQPCGIDGFSGAEYVCCPIHAPEKHNHGNNTAKHQASTSTTTRTTTATTTTTTTTTTTAKPTTPMATTPAEAAAAAAAESEYLRYLRNPIDPNLSEHEYYLHAKADLDKRHHEKVTKMMKEWANARHRVQEIKKKDVKGGEKFNREMTARFQKAYETLEHEGIQQKKQLSSVHQQRVQAELNKKKRLALDSYLEALRDEEPDATRVLKSLMHYIKTEQKDRIHTINHYQHVQESDPVEAESIRSDIADHLRETDQRVTQAIDMLGQLPKYEKKIRAQIEKFLSSYQSLDESLSVIMTKINEQSNAAKKMTKQPEQPADEDNNDDDDDDDDDSDNGDDVDDDDDEEEDEEDGNEPATTTTTAAFSTKKDESSTAAKNVLSTTNSANSAAAAAAATTLRDSSSPLDQQVLLSSPRIVQSQFLTSSADEDKDAPAAMAAAAAAATAGDKRHHYVEVKPADHVAYVDKSDLTVLENYIKKRPVKAETNFNVAAPLGIAIGGIAVFVAIVVGIAMLRKRVSGVPARQSVTEIDPRASTANAAVASAAAAAAAAAAAVPKKTPPINGYENPTYQYYASNA